jgi:hypothetical protein
LIVTLPIFFLFNGLKKITVVNDEIKIGLALKPNAVIYFELNRIQRKSDRENSYERAVKGED